MRNARFFVGKKAQNPPKITGSSGIFPPFILSMAARCRQCQ
jgi:hypothetical protein